MGEFLTFRKMVTPIFIQLLFWLGVIAVIGTGIFMMTLGDNVLLGVAAVLLGPIVVRIYAELLIVIFRIQGSLNELVKLQRDNGTMGTHTMATQPAGGANWASAQTNAPTHAGPGPSGPMSPPSGPPPSGSPSN